MSWSSATNVQPSGSDSRKKSTSSYAESSSTSCTYSLRSSVLDMTMPFRNPKGLSWFVTALFIVDDMAGGGLVALPTAMVQTEFYSGFALLIVMMSATLYTAWALGNSWNILLNTWPEYRVHCRKPYPEIAFRAMGEHARRFVSIINDITQFGISTVYLLLSSKNIHDVVKTYAHTNFSYCFVVLILAVCLLPVTLLKSPQDFWWAVVAAMFTTAAAVVLIVVGISLDFGLCSQYTCSNDRKCSY